MKPIKNEEHEMIEGHESAVRKIVAEAHGEDYRAIKSFEEAKATSGAYVIMEGDYGGQIYLTCPMTLVNCNKNTLHSLLCEIDALEWGCNDETGRGLYYEILEVGEGVAGGMGGGVALDKLWVHEELSELKDKIECVLLAKCEHI